MTSPEVASAEYIVRVGAHRLVDVLDFSLWRHYRARHQMSGSEVSIGPAPAVIADCARLSDGALRIRSRDRRPGRRGRLAHI
jgi:hypothetical protein